MTKNGFTTSELTLSYPEFKALEKQPMSEELQKWLREWNLLDLAISPTGYDDTRKMLRLGHYTGWFGRDESWPYPAERPNDE